MFHSSYNVLFFVRFIFASVNIELLWLAKQLRFSLTCPKDFPLEALWLFNLVHFYLLLPLSVSSHFSEHCGFFFLERKGTNNFEFLSALIPCVKNVLW